MKKIFICLLLIPMLSPANQAYARKAKAGRNGAPAVAGGNRLNAAVNRIAASKREGNTPSNQMQRKLQLFPGANPDLSSGTAQQPPGDRPFDGPSSAANPFDQPDSSPGTLWSTPVFLESTTNPFRPVATTVNPFQSARSNPLPFASIVPGFAVPVALSNPAAAAMKGSATPTVPTSPGVLPSPWGNTNVVNNPFSTSPVSTPPMYPKDTQGNPYSLDNFLPGKARSSR